MVSTTTTTMGNDQSKGGESSDDDDKAANNDAGGMKSQLQVKTAEAELERRVESLQQELKKATEQLQKVRGEGGGGQVVTTTTKTLSPVQYRTTPRPSPTTFGSTNYRPPEKRGYLFKWMDRSIGWGGTKWSLRFVVLERGRLSYYSSHTDTSSPRYVLSLRGFDVRDDGWKRNPRHQSWYSRKSSSSTPPPLDEPGAYFFVFSIIQRPETDGESDSDSDSDSDGENNDNERGEDYANIVPLLRFSTPSMTDKNLWIQLLSEACAYCETEEFAQQEDNRDQELARQQQQQANMAHLMPEAKEGTLPPLYFAPAAQAAANTAAATSMRMKQQRRPSGAGKSMRSNSSGSKRNLHASKSAPQKGDVDQADAKSTLGYPPSKPMHRSAAPSFLSAEASAQHFRGLFNLGVLILIVSNVRLLIDTVRRYGLVPALLGGEQQDDDDDESSQQVHRYVKGSILRNYKERLDRQQPWQEFPFATGVTLQFCFLLVAYAMEKMLAKKWIRESIGMLLHYMNAHAALLIPIYIVWNDIESPVVGAILLFHASITWMKLVSYAHANQDYRFFSVFAYNNSKHGGGSGGSGSGSERDGDMKNSSGHHRHSHHQHHHNHRQAQLQIENLDEQDSEILYPQNVTLGNLLYFWCAPTLTYQIAFPKYPIVRWWKVIGILMRLTIVAMLIMFLAAQVMSPTLQDLVKDLEVTTATTTLTGTAAWMETFYVFTEYWMKLSIASTYMWLLIFYGYFHLYLNLFAELLRFGDRVFYKDWWNSSEASAFWRLWNVPVHYWLIRHVYFPCIRLKISKQMATLIVFSLSAIMHEVLVSVPFHMIRPWSYLGMMMQIPLVAITKKLYRKYPGSSIGNIIFWISFCVVGQPMAVLLYTVDYQFHKHSSSLMETAAAMDGGVQAQQCGDMMNATCSTSRRPQWLNVFQKA